VTIVDTSPLELVGEWRLARRVHDRRLGVFGTMTGTLVLERAAAGVRWREHGRFVFGAHAYDSSRELLLQPDGGAWSVRFADGREFHPWQPGVMVTHPCRADVYRGIVDVDATGTRLRTLWDVTGPAKDQRLLTRCTRA
jgi:Family of unknown function (DUF6314)